MNLISSASLGQLVMWIFLSAKCSLRVADVNIATAIDLPEDSVGEDFIRANPGSFSATQPSRKPPS